ncbi:MAG: oligosaccharide flippase family protein, partial [Bacteroides sp.]
GIIMAINGMSYWGIASQTVIYICIVNSFYWYFSPWRPTLHLNFHPLKNMFGFSSKILVSTIFTQINNNLFSVLLGKFYSTSEVGYYAQANKWSTMGYSFIGGMVNGVAHPVLAEVSTDHRRQLNIFRKMLRFTAFISFPSMFGIALIAQELIVIAVTDKWQPCVPILQLLCIWGAFIPINSLYSNLIISKNKSNIFMWNTILLGIVQILTMLLVYPHGIFTMIITFISINIGWLFIWQFFAYQLLQFSLWNAMKDIIPFATTAAITMIITYYITLDIENIYILLIAKVFIAAVLYSLFMKMSNSSIFKESIRFLLKKKQL